MAGNSIGKWSAQATLDAKGFQSGIQQMQSSIRGFVQGPNGIGMLTNLPSALGISSIQGVLSRISDTIESELDFGFLADQLGAPLSFLHQLRVIAGENSVEADQFTSAMERMNQVLGQARLGSAEAVETFGRLGISIEDLRDQDFQTLFLRAARSLDGMTDRAVRARIAVELFGRQGAANMLRFVRDIDGALADMEERGIGEGADRALERINELDTALDTLSTRWDEFWRRGLAAAAPALTGLLDLLVTGFTVNHDDLGSFGQSALVNPFFQLTFGMMELDDSVREAGQHVKDVGGEIKNVFIEDINAFKNAIQETADAAQNAAFSLGGFIGEIADQVAAGAAQGAATGESPFRPQFPSPDSLPTDEEFQEERRRAERDADRFIEAGRSPFERFQEDVQRLRELFESADLTEEQMNRGIANALNQLQQTIPEAADVGSLDAGSAEVAAIIAHANDPQLTALHAIEAAERMHTEAVNRNTIAVEAVRRMLERQNEQAARALPNL